MADYWFYKERGVCVDCHHEKAFGKFSRCPACIERRQVLYAPTPEQRSRWNANDRALRAERRAAGVCTECGKPRIPGHVKCEKCVYKSRKRMQQHRERSNKKYAELGLCLFCGAERAKDKKFCPACLEKKRQNAEYARSFIDRDKQRKKDWAISQCVRGGAANG